MPLGLQPTKAGVMDVFAGDCGAVLDFVETREDESDERASD